ncbi:MAG: ATP-binding protein [Armatimonadetes bacterium]|nr:ATP-binding protein [Armatimonadota bacterium]
MVGPNNEGKSNILLALSLAFQAVKAKGQRLSRELPNIPGLLFRSDVGYDWERDFPQALQDDPTGRSSFVAEIELNPAERDDFRRQFAVNLKSLLKLEVALGRDEWRVSVIVSGVAKKPLNEQVDAVFAFVDERLDLSYVPSIRTPATAIEAVREIVSTVLSPVRSTQEYRRHLEAVRSLEREYLDALTVSLTQTIKSFVPDVVDIAITQSARSAAYRPREEFELTVDDGVATALALKGDGIKSLVAIAIIRYAAQQGMGERNLLLAVEEPEVHLHPAAIRKLRDLLFEISGTQQVVVSTHSPLLVNIADVKSNIVVRKGKGAAAKDIKQVRDVLGVLVSDNLTTARLVLITEGQEDKLVLDAWLRGLSPRLRSAIIRGDLVIAPLGGAGNLAYVASAHLNLMCQVHAFMDHDTAGRQEAEKAISDAVLARTDVTYASCLGFPESEIEDLLLLRSYSDEVKNEFGVSLDPPHPRLWKRKSKWSTRVRDVFIDRGQTWSETREKEVKMCVAGAAASKGTASLDRLRRGPVEELVNALEEKL